MLHFTKIAGAQLVTFFLGDIPEAAVLLLFGGVFFTRRTTFKCCLKTSNFLKIRLSKRAGDEAEAALEDIIIVRPGMSVILGYACKIFDTILERQDGVLPQSALLISSPL